MKIVKLFLQLKMFLIVHNFDQATLLLMHVRNSQLHFTENSFWIQWNLWIVNRVFSNDFIFYTNYRNSLLRRFLLGWISNFKTVFLKNYWEITNFQNQKSRKRNNSWFFFCKQNFQFIIKSKWQLFSHVIMSGWLDLW